eukprot:gnl/TRDRNA2_/TRDRNA2_183020_c0_seq1.p1 gnl/TRDRNA2_/TRDRNA2_183020_c0~~gnl/TRDRNA2_/TRDRNA2_183020_c0_seq1.p1  ORF type:complete len:450 (-),score=88.37 gnl/TRDRNA2_/TRDRNA2_183020_c0_seq1:81-1361(-)
MREDDPRVKALQELAWGLQSKCNNPSKKLPEDVKKKSYSLASRAVSLCGEVAYIAEADFIERADAFTKEITARKAELDIVEAEVTKAKENKCLRPKADGSYEVVQRSSPGSYGGPPAKDKSWYSKADESSGPKALGPAGGAPNLLRGPSVSSEPLSAAELAEVASRCSSEGAMLVLSGLRLQDCNLEPVCEALRRTDSQLTVLDLSDNSLTDTGVQRLVTTLASGASPKLQDLWLSGNAFGDLGAAMLRSGLGALRRSLVVHTEGVRPSEGAAETSTCAVASDAVGATADAATRPGESVANDVSSDAAAANAGDSAATSVSSVETAAATADDRSPPASCVEEAGVSEGSATVEVVGEQVVVTVHLPEGVTSSQELETDVSATEVIVRRASSGGLVAHATLPHAVDADSAQASFSRKRRTMTITLQG